MRRRRRRRRRGIQRKGKSAEGEGKEEVCINLVIVPRDTSTCTVLYFENHDYVIMM